MTVARPIELEGHVIDSGTLQRCMTTVMEMGGDFDVEQFDVGRHKMAESYCRMLVMADDEATLHEILHELHQTGAQVPDPRDAQLEPAPADQVVPTGFYSTTNHPTEVRHGGEWLDVERIEMDCAVIVEPDADGGPRAYTKVLNAIEAGDLVVTDEFGVRVDPPDRPRGDSGPFGFMQGGVSPERPSESLIEDVADVIRDAKDDGGRVLAVVGPALLHSGAGPAFARLVREGYVDALSTGNGFAVHDVERQMYGTSLGMNVETLESPRKGHKHHIYAISEIIRAGGLEAAVDAGILESGVMYDCIQHDVDYVLAGSIRDDGPLPDTITDAVDAQNAIREQAHDADVVLMLSTLLHSVAVGNCLPSTTPVVCVDIDPSTVTQLLDRGSSQAVGMVTDVGTFVPTLADKLIAPSDDAE
jgi:lysine-ketoglutarate reductase/saccharopine dehydrogenase-like protein (TIGR00300 family)